MARRSVISTLYEKQVALTPFEVDVLMKYLINSLINLEDGHQDALNPTAIDKSKFYLSEDELTKPITRADVHYLKETIITAVQTTVKTAIQSGPTLGVGAGGPCTGSITEGSLRTAVSSCLGGPVEMTSGDLEAISSGCESPTVSQQSTPDLETLSIAKTCQSTQWPKGWLPIPGVSIPNIGRSHDSWREAIRQWEQGDPSKNICALKDWPTEWYTGLMRPLTGVKRQNRRLISEEYERWVDSWRRLSNAHLSLSALVGMMSHLKVSTGMFEARLPSYLRFGEMEWSRAGWRAGEAKTAALKRGLLNKALLTTIPLAKKMSESQSHTRFYAHIRQAAERNFRAL